MGSLDLEVPVDYRYINVPRHGGVVGNCHGGEEISKC